MLGVPIGTKCGLEGLEHGKTRLWRSWGISRTKYREAGRIGTKSCGPTGVSTSASPGTPTYGTISVMKTNQNMRRLLTELQTSPSVLSPELLSILASGFVEEKGCVLLASETHDSAFDRAATLDETGYECFINHVHVERLGEALEFARRLKKALAATFAGDFVVIVSFDGHEATVRFHRLRAGQTWLNENLEEYREEGIAVIDSN
jgi:hypothetical protein